MSDRILAARSLECLLFIAAAMVIACVIIALTGKRRLERDLRELSQKLDAWELPLLQDNS
jgi:hypothetical protein